MIPMGTQIKVTDRFAARDSYTDYVGLVGKIASEREEDSRGFFYRVSFSPRKSMNIDEEDCIPVNINNKSFTSLLLKSDRK